MVTRARHLGLIVAGIACTVMLPCFAADSAGKVNIVSPVSQPGANGEGALEVVKVGSDAVVLVPVDAASPDETLQGKVVQLAKTILGTEASKPKHLVVIFVSKSSNNKLKGASITADQLEAITSDQKKVALVPCERSQATFDLPTTASAIVQSQAVTGGMTSSTPFLNERTKLASRIEALSAKGVGTRMYSEQLAKIDEQFVQGHGDSARNMLSDLSDAVKENEVRFAPKLKAGISVSATLPTPPPIPPGVGAVPPVAGTAVAARPGTTPAAPGHPAMIAPDKSISDFKGTEVDLARSVITMFVGRELGVDAPKEGPFLVERLRIGRRIQELASKGIKVDSYRSYNHDRIEAIVTAQMDQRRLPELRDAIKYLEQMLGLPALAAAKPATK